MPTLDDQLTTWTPLDGTSPDRLDALVWAVTELTSGQAQRFIEHMRRKAEAAQQQAAAEADKAAEAEAEIEQLDEVARRQAARNAAFQQQRDSM
jgi:excinuclease UvrABC nuclease subunit